MTRIQAEIGMVGPDPKIVLDGADVSDAVTHAQLNVSEHGMLLLLQVKADGVASLPVEVRATVESSGGALVADWLRSIDREKAKKAIEADFASDPSDLVLDWLIRLAEQL